MPIKSLQKILSTHFFRYSLIPIFVVEVMLLVLYFSINAYISTKNTNLLLSEAKNYTQEILINESKFISDKLNEVTRLAKMLQNEHQAIFENPNAFGLPNGEPIFEKASNGVLYKVNKVGSSLYYSSNTKITEKELAKATYTEAMDVTLKSIVDTNPNVVAAYFNSWDDLNRLYPFIDNVSEQYGSHINMEDYNFYYLADLKHNPKKEPVWTGAYLDPAGNGWMLSCIVPIYNGDILEGVTGIDITIDAFVKNILNRKLAYNASLFMVDKEGMIIAMNEKVEELLGLNELKEHLYTDAILKTIEKPEEFNILKNRSPFASHFKKLIEEGKVMESLSINEHNFLTLQQNVKESNWKLMVLVDENEIYKSVLDLKKLSNEIGYWAIGFLLIFYAIFFFLLLKRINHFSKAFTDPIVRLSEQTSKIKDGNTKVELKKSDVFEINQLNNNFTKMMNELNQKTKDLYKSIKVTQELSHAKDEFLANMSHELKTPLNSINLISSIMLKNKKGNLDLKDIESLKVVNSSGNDLLFLINDVLDISKLEAGEIKLHFTDIKVNNLVQEVYNSFKAQMEDKGLNFTLEIDKNLRYIHSDEDRIKQILKNLISNALKFTKEGEVSFIVKDRNEFIEFFVVDTGIGIQENKLNTIFDRFKQIDSSTTRNFGGTGLGLSISKKLSNLLGGDIYVESQVNKGSTFKIKIESNKDKIHEITSNEDAEELLGKDKVLIFNNDPVNFISLVVSLKKEYNVENLGSFEELLQFAESQKFDKIVVDASDVEINDLLKLKKFNEKVIVIYSKEIKSSELIKKEFNFTFHKPFDIEEIKQLLKQ